MSDNRIITQVQLVEEGSGHICATATTKNKKEVPLFAFYPDWVSFEESELLGISVGSAQKLFIHKMKNAKNIPTC